MQSIKHYYDVWIFEVVFEILNVWELALLIVAWGQTVPVEVNIEQLLKSQLLKGNLNNWVAVINSVLVSEAVLNWF